MSKYPSVAIIGSGNVAWHLAPALDNAGYSVREVYSKNPLHAEALIERLYDAEVKATLDFSTSPSRIFIIAVSDDAIEDVVREIVLPEEAVLIHTSGSQPLDALSFAAATYPGVLYPLQTFTKESKMDFQSIPVFIETTNPAAEKLLTTLANSITDHVHKITSSERKALHVAAVFASNFTNHMLLLSQQIMKENSLSYDWLKPLIESTIVKSLQIGPENAQTGPARRGDFETLDKHVEFLQDDESVLEIYKIVSQDIVDRYQSEE